MVKKNLRVKVPKKLIKDPTDKKIKGLSPSFGEERLHGPLARGLSPSERLHGSKIRGDGIKEALEVVGAVATGNVDKILGRRPKNLKELLKTHGDKTISSIVVSKNPIRKGIQLLANNVTNIQKIMKSRNYDNMFHLFANFKLDDGTVVGLEKNQRINIKLGGFDVNPKSKHVIKSLKNQMTLNDLYEQAEKKFGNDFYIYTALKNNCQRYIANLLEILGVLTPRAKKFILQFTEGLLSDNVNKVVNTITNIAGLFDFVIKGGGKKESKKEGKKEGKEEGKKKEPKNNPWLDHVRKYREDNPDKSYKEALKCAKCTYKK